MGGRKRAYREYDSCIDPASRQVGRDVVSHEWTGAPKDCSNHKTRCIPRIQRTH